MWLAKLPFSKFNTPCLSVNAKARVDMDVTNCAPTSIPEVVVGPEGYLDIFRNALTMKAIARKSGTPAHSALPQL